MTGSLHLDLRGCVAVVTGGARGLGRAMSLALMDAGASVVAVARSAGQVAAFADEANGMGLTGRCQGVVADVSDERQCAHVIDRAERLFGTVNVLVNNAAVGPYANPAAQSVTDPLPFWTIPTKILQSMVSVNLVGTFFMFRAALPAMLRSNSGRIVNISTSRPTMRRANSGPYGPLKAALEATTCIWAQELSGTGVTVNTLLPGGICDTDFVPGNVGHRASPFQAGKGALGLEGKDMQFLPSDIMGPPVVWLASAASDGVTGRRFVARDWDPDLPAQDAAWRAMQPAADVPVIM
jgi:NAD(P)-dependent dehydrogenase (short-subunit alcohol dehydrogenase family)